MTHLRTVAPQDAKVDAIPREAQPCVSLHHRGWIGPNSCVPVSECQPASFLVGLDRNCMTSEHVRACVLRGWIDVFELAKLTAKLVKKADLETICTACGAALRQTMPLLRSRIGPDLCKQLG